VGAYCDNDRKDVAFSPEWRQSRNIPGSGSDLTCHTLRPPIRFRFNDDCEGMVHSWKVEAKRQHEVENRRAQPPARSAASG